MRTIERQVGPLGWNSDLIFKLDSRPLKVTNELIAN